VVRRLRSELGTVGAQSERKRTGYGRGVTQGRIPRTLVKVADPGRESYRYELAMSHARAESDRYAPDDDPCAPNNPPGQGEYVACSGRNPV
jgi:hypothetical protein